VNAKRFGRVLALLLLVGVLVTSTGCTKQKAEQAKPAATEQPAAETSARADLLVSVEDLAAAPDQYFIIDARDPKAYEAGHIPGAVSGPWQTFATVAQGKPGDKDWGVLAKPQAIADAAGKLGVDTDKTIVIYSDPTGWGEDGRVVWTLRSIGIENTRILDGGFPGWTAAGKESSTEVPKLAATTVAVAGDKLGDINVTTDEVKKAVEDGSAIIVDARSAKEYGGATDFGEARGGHIEGAVNIPFPTLFNENGTLKSDDDLNAMFTEAGLGTDKPIIVYCTKGIRSAFMTEVLRMLGYAQAKNYDASYYSWAGDSALPIEK